MPTSDVNSSKTPAPGAILSTSRLTPSSRKRYVASCLSPIPSVYLSPLEEFGICASFYKNLLIARDITSTLLCIPATKFKEAHRISPDATPQERSILGSVVEAPRTRLFVYNLAHVILVVISGTTAQTTPPGFMHSPLTTVSQTSPLSGCPGVKGPAFSVMYPTSDPLSARFASAGCVPSNSPITPPLKIVRND